MRVEFPFLDLAGDADSFTPARVVITLTVAEQRTLRRIAAGAVLDDGTAVTTAEDAVRLLIERTAAAGP